MPMDKSTLWITLCRNPRAINSQICLLWGIGSAFGSAFLSDKVSHSFFDVIFAQIEVLCWENLFSVLHNKHKKPFLLISGKKIVNSFTFLVHELPWKLCVGFQSSEWMMFGISLSVCLFFILILSCTFLPGHFDLSLYTFGVQKVRPFPSMNQRNSRKKC